MTPDQAAASNREKQLTLKARCDALLAQLQKAERELPMWTGVQRRVATRDIEAISKCLRDAKDELRRLSGTHTGDPKWALIARCYRFLNALDESALGDEGEALLQEIEFHVPPAKLVSNG